ncbi:MAG: family 10 glycosylhydrolase [Barnesiella sp.]
MKAYCINGIEPQAYRTEHPDWLLDYPGASILNPGKPEVRNRITDIVSEIVRNYDVDGIVFDDYFYMEGTTDAMDQDLFEANNPDNLERGDWRRQNVNKMVKQVYDMIKIRNLMLIWHKSPGMDKNASIASKYDFNSYLHPENMLIMVFIAIRCVDTGKSIDGDPSDLLDNRLVQ